MIRVAVQEDIPAIQQIAATSWSYTYEGIIPEAIQQQFISQAYAEEWLQHRLNETIVYVVMEAEQVVGFVNVKPLEQPGHYECLALYLQPTVFRKGYGTKLLQHVIKDFSIESMTLIVEKDNKIGRSFYEAFGFEEVQQFEEDFLGHSLQSVEMRWSHDME